MAKRSFYKPNTPCDVARNENVPELIISCEGQDKKGQYFGYITMNMVLRKELEACNYINVGFYCDCEQEDDRMNIMLSNAPDENLVAFKLDFLNTTIKNKWLFNEMVKMLGLDFGENKTTYHFFDIKFGTLDFENSVAFVNTAKFYTTKYKILPYSEMMMNEWRDFYDKPTR